MHLSKEFLSIFNTYFVTAIAVAFYIFSSKDKHYKEMIYVMFLTMLYNSILKELFKLPLPVTYHANCYGFPSGHMNFQSVFYIWMIIENKNNIFRLLLFVLWILTGVAMVFAGYHFARDVIITPIFSLACILISKYIIKKSNSKNNTELIFIIIAFVFTIINYLIANKMQYHVSLALQSVYGLALFSILADKRKVNFTLKLSFVIVGAFYLIATWNDKRDLYLVLLNSRFFLLVAFIVFFKKLLTKFKTNGREERI